jgi:hypothetical protein
VWFVNGAHDIIVRHLRVRMGGNMKHDAGKPFPAPPVGMDAVSNLSHGRSPTAWIPITPVTEPPSQRMGTPMSRTT